MVGYVSRLSGVVNALHSETLAALRDEGVRVDAADGDAPLQPGAAQRVEARLPLAPTPLAAQIWRRARQALEPRLAA